MFTGLIQSMGTVCEVAPDGAGGQTIGLTAPGFAMSGILGESIAIDGVCLTVVGFDDQTLQFQAGPETLARTTLKQMAVGHRVNLERALKVGDAIGGHFVTGHVDGLGRLIHRQQTGEWQTLTFEYDPILDDLIVLKGSIAIDGISLTIANLLSNAFQVMLIPHTIQETTLGQKTVGSAVNLEADLLAKHVRRLFQNLSIKV